ncbi:MAG: flagellar filament capping protein FliD [bacterium]|nr:flagellar filament capping protein FliD [bacterium]
MSGISSGVGLVSGLPTTELIESLLLLERRPIDLLETRVGKVQTSRTAWADLAARLLSVKSVVSRFSETSFFKRFDTTSSDENVLTAVASENAVAGTYDLVVRSLVSNHQLIGDGFSDADTTPIGAGSLSIEVGEGKVNSATSLDELRGGDGVRRGKIRITDRSGASADVNLTTVVTLSDVVDEINSAQGINVRARISGDALVVEDLNENATTEMSIVDVGVGRTAADLGVAQSVADNLITGADLVYLADSTALDALNDGNGVRNHVAGGDFRITQSNVNSFEVSLAADLARNPATYLAQLNNGNGVRLGTIRITDRSGASAEVDLSAAETAQDVMDAINNSGVGVSATVGRDYFQVSDQTETAEEAAVNLKIEDVSGHAARDLGIAVDEDADSFTGSEVFRITTVGDVLRAINYAPGNQVAGQPQVVAAISDDGNGIVLRDESGGAQPLKIEALELNGVISGAAADLGILGEFSSGVTAQRDLLAGPNTVLLNSLNGGAGVTTRGSIRITARDGETADIDLGDAQTLQDVIDRINEAASDEFKVSAAVNRVGNGLVLTDASGGTGLLSVADLDTSTMAQDLGLAGSAAATGLDSGNLQLRYVSENTRLDELNYGAGVRTGRVQIADSAGVITSINVTENQTTLQDIINLINGGLAEVTARVNSAGDGLEVVDEAGGTGSLTITDLDGGTVAADLRIAGEASDGETSLNGSYEISIDIDADDTLNDVALKINEAGVPLRAGVLNDGGTNGYRLTLASQVGGRGGELTFDTGDTGLAMETLVRAQDAVVLFGGAGGENPLLITSSTNTLTDVVPNVSIDLVGTSEEAVQLSVAQDLDAALADVDLFVSSYNAVLERIDDYTAFDAETETRGPLLGDGTLQRIESRLRRAATREYQNVPAQFDRLFSVGLSVGSGGRLTLDEDEFREAYASDPHGVEQLFSTAETGLGDYLDNMLDELTRSDDGLVSRADNLLADREELLEERIDAMEVLLEKKRGRLERQFAALEQSLSLLQGQQSALTSLSAMAESE